MMSRLYFYLIVLQIAPHKKCRSPLSYYDIIYMMTPDFWRYRRACKIVHKFSMDVIKKRRAVLEEKVWFDVLSCLQRF